MLATPPAINVLIIDDSEIARADMERRLTLAGLRVSSIASPIGATRVIVDQAIDVVLVDVQMPNMRGDRLAALFKENPRFSRLSVILVSGCGDEELDRLQVASRADAVLSKSRLHQLVAVVKDTHHKRARATSANTGGR